MRHISWLLVFVLVGCKQKDPVLAVNASQLIGTWTSASVNVGARPFTRWTFEPDSVYVAYDALTACQPVDRSSTSLYSYSLEDDKLILVYWGISVGPGFFPNPPITRRILSLTASELVLDAPRQVFEKCP